MAAEDPNVFATEDAGDGEELTRFRQGRPEVLAMAFAIWVGLVIFQVVGLFVHPKFQPRRICSIRFT